MGESEGVLSGRLAVVTGGGGGIGAAICVALAKKCARVVVADICFEAAQKVAAVLPGPVEHRAVYVDIGDAQSVEKLFREIPCFSDVPATILVNCASKSGPLTSFENVTEDMFDAEIRINLKGTFLMSREAARAMLAAGVTDGSIVNITSKVTQRPSSFLSPYVTAKGGIEALTRAIAADLSRRGIRCNSVSPGLTDTPSTSVLSKEFLRSLERASPLGRPAHPEEIANVVAFLCCPESSYVIGTKVDVA